MAAAPAPPEISALGRADMRLASLALPLTTFAILSYEIVLTRLFAYTFTYHLTALAVSFAIFGLGAGAYLRVRWLSQRPQHSLAVFAHAGAGLSLIALYVALMLTNNPAVVVAASAAPFVFAGIALSHYYETRRSERAAATYALDLAGAAAACAVSVALIVSVGADGALLLLAAFSGAVALLTVARADSDRRTGLVACAAACVLLAAGGSLLRSGMPDPLLNRHSGADKQLPRLLREQGEVIDTAWSAVGRADLYRTPRDPDRLIFSDAMNTTVFLADTPEGLKNLFASLMYTTAPVHNALIIGSGAGLEVRVARDAGVPHVDAVEFNDAIIRLVRKWQSFGGPIYDQPGVTLFAEEGR
jgi:hypothetical protein